MSFQRLSDKEPEHGQLCVVLFSGDYHREMEPRVCRWNTLSITHDWYDIKKEKGLITDSPEDEWWAEYPVEMVKP